MGTFVHAPPVESPGRVLDPAVQKPMEQAFGRSLGGIRVHTGTEAADATRQLHASAFTIGEHIVLGHDGDDANTLEGRLLLAHELAHAIQQSRSGASAGPGGSDSGREQDADRAALAVWQGRPARVSTSAPVGVAPAEEDWFSRFKKTSGAVAKDLGRRKLEQVLGTAEGVVLEGATVVDTLTWAAYAEIDAVDAVVTKGAALGGLSKPTTQAIRSVAHGLANDNAGLLKPLREAAKGAGLTDNVTGAPTLAPLVSKPGDALLRELDESGFQATPDDSLFTDREVSQLTGAVGFQVLLATLGVEEVQLALKVVGALGAVENIVRSVQESERAKTSFLASPAFWLAVGEAVLFVVGLKSAAGSHKLLSAFVDAASLALGTAPAVLKYIDDVQTYRQPDRDQVLHADLLALAKAAIAVMRQIVQHAGTLRRAGASGKAAPAAGVRPAAGKAAGGKSAGGKSAGGRTENQIRVGEGPPVKRVRVASDAEPATVSVSPEPDQTSVASEPKPLKAARLPEPPAPSTVPSGVPSAPPKAAPVPADSTTNAAPAPKTVSPPKAATPSAGGASAAPAEPRLGVVHSQRRVKGAQTRLAQAEERLRLAGNRVANHEERLAEATSKGHKTTHINQQLAGARNHLDAAAAEVAKATTTLATRAKALAEAHERANKPAVSTQEKPRLGVNDPFGDTKNFRRPDLDTFKNIPPVAIVRHDGSGGGAAGVSIYQLALPTRLGAVKGNTPQERGHNFEQSLTDETGGRFRVSHESGDKPRHGDVGPHEAKHGAELSANDLDQLWRDMHDYDQHRRDRAAPHIITPRISDTSADKLARLVAIFRTLSGRDMRVVVRETGP